MKVLYITDLDGTLLTPEGVISPRSLEMLNGLIASGTLIACATARSASTALPITAKLQLELPLILMNGAAVYDTRKKRYISESDISGEISREVLKTLQALRCPAFVYTIRDGRLVCFSPPFMNHGMKAFREYREKVYGKRFEDIPSYEALLEVPVIYFTFVGEREKLLPVYERMREVKGLHALFYEDVYGDDWFLEVSRADVSKGLAASWLKREISADKLVVFGDNLNDLPLFEAADFSFATENAKPALKARANRIIGPNTTDAVAETLYRISLGQERIFDR